MARLQIASFLQSGSAVKPRVFQTGVLCASEGKTLSSGEGRAALLDCCAVARFSWYSPSISLGDGTPLSLRPGTQAFLNTPVQKDCRHDSHTASCLSGIRRTLHFSFCLVFSRFYDSRVRARTVGVFAHLCARILRLEPHEGYSISARDCVVNSLPALW